MLPRVSMGVSGARVSEGAACPGCGNPTLSAEPTPPGAFSCQTCSGWFFDRDAAYHFLVEDVGLDGPAIGRMLSAPGARKRACAACGDETREIIAQGESVDLCGRCGAAFLDAPVLARLGGGRYGRAVPRPITAVSAQPPIEDEVREERPLLPEAPLNPFGDPETSGPIPIPPGFTPPPPPTSSTTALSALAAQPRAAGASSPGASSPGLSSPAGLPATAAGTSSSSAASTSDFSDARRSSGAVPAAPPTGARTVLLVAGAALVLLAVAGGVVGVVALSGEDGGDEAAPEQSADERYARYLRHYPIGGQSVSVWAEHLTRFRPGGPEENAQLYALTKERASRAGLVVHEESAGVRVEMEPRLVKRMLKRLELQ